MQTKFSKKIVIICISVIIIYTIVHSILSYRVGIELAPTLTTCVYAFFGTELAACAFIKILGDKPKTDSLEETLLEMDIPEIFPEEEDVLG